MKSKPYKQPKSATMKSVPVGEAQPVKKVTRGETQTAKAKPDTSCSKVSGEKRANHPGSMTMIPKGM